MAIIQDDWQKEQDTCYTPLEQRRRSEMKVRTVRMGFFRVGQAQRKIKCTTCRKDITNTPHRAVNGVHYCNGC